MKLNSKTLLIAAVSMMVIAPVAASLYIGLRYCGPDSGKSAAMTPTTEHGGCGTAGSGDGCCAGKKADTLELPPGHPPISSLKTHDGCEADAHSSPSIPTGGTP